MKARFTMPEENFNRSDEDRENQARQEENESGSSLFEEDSAADKSQPRQPRRVTLTTFICVCVAVTLAAVMLTYTLLSSAYQKKLADIKLAGQDTVPPEGVSYDLQVLDGIFKANSFEELDGEELRVAVLKAYVYATGDRYAEYYTDEEFAALSADIGGESQGIGINIVNSEVEINSVTRKALKVVNVVKNSPAERAALRNGDYIVAVGSIADDTAMYIQNYDTALRDLQGVAGTEAKFVVYREGYEQNGGFMDFAITREAFTADSVMYGAVDSDVGENIGLIKIIEFDSTTPKQVDTAIEALKDAGCDRFVFDVRYNPGGTLDSIVAVLSRFLDEGDTVISTKDKAGKEQITKVAPVSSTNGCEVLAEDIGKYKDLNMVVLCNENTASAAELFVANFDDHELGATVGVKTFGKGSMQRYINLAAFGCSGYLKMTTHMYYPPSGEGYDGIGIEPQYKAEQSSEAAEKNIYDIMGTKQDDQLTEAVKHFK